MCEISFSHLESAHVPWIPCILQTVLIALEKELKEESEREHKRKQKTISSILKTEMLKKDNKSARIFPPYAFIQSSH